MKYAPESTPSNPTPFDALYFESKGVGFEGVDSGAYFIYRVDESRIKLSRSKADLARNIYITFNGSVTDAPESTPSNPTPFDSKYNASPV